MFADLHRFVDRRIAELSAEVYGAVQLVDLSEANVSKLLGQMTEQIGSLIAAPAAATRNSGIELEAVVKLTETAATQIMEAAEAISAWIDGGRRDPEAVEGLAARVNAIFEACTFQDLTGQRIRRAIEQLQNVETMLDGLIPHAGPHAPASQPAEAVPVNADLMQGGNRSHARLNENPVSRTAQAGSRARPDRASAATECRQRRVVADNRSRR